MDAADDLFTREDPIFANKELLEISHLPERVGSSAATTDRRPCDGGQSGDFRSEPE